MCSAGIFSWEYQRYSANLSAHIKRHEGSIKKMVNDKDGEGQMPLELAISGETQTSCGCCLPQVQM